METTHESLINVSIASDYAVLEQGDYTTEYHPFSFYYGYEWGRKDEQEVWGFSAEKNGKKIFSISYEDMKKEDDCPNQMECGECLLFGIGLYLRQLK
ncbi:MAG: hypothetical protein PHW73_05930 [Atribacterota bacterium]|nr:hypothetical protein [Atribacterota bacterium]